MKLAYRFSAILALVFVVVAHAASLENALRGRRSAMLKPSDSVISLRHNQTPGGASFGHNGTLAENDRLDLDWHPKFFSQSETDAWLLKDTPYVADVNASVLVASNASLVAAKRNVLAYSSCTIWPQACTIDTARVSADLLGRVVLILGCSLDIYALNYFCTAAGAPVNGYSRKPGNEKYGKGNFAWCNIGGFILAYSFHPGSSGPPYFEACDKVLGGPCSQIRTDYLVQQSISKVMTTFGIPPTEIVVDSSLWDAANWWSQQGKPPEPYLVPGDRLYRWCAAEFPTLINTVQMASPTSKVAFRTAPRIEPALGYGHSMHNIDGMNSCFRESALTNLASYQLIDYNLIVETFLMSQGSPPKPFYEDPFHPGILPSVFYVDAVLQWAARVPIR
jgi:hypothetical protein